MDEGVETVDPVQESRSPEKPVLDGLFDEDVESLFDVDDLQGMYSGDVDGAFDKG